MYIVNLVTHSSNAKMYGSNVRMYFASATRQYTCTVSKSVRVCIMKDLLIMLHVILLLIMLHVRV